MNENLDNNEDFLKKIKSFFYKNKLKILFIVSAIFIVLIFTIFLNEKEKRSNLFISEKYIKAGILISKNQKKIAKSYYEEIVLSNNKFYSLLALNTLIEKELVNNEQIINYFTKLENSNFSEELTDLILLKKALYLIKIKDNSGQKILNKLIKDDSNLKSLAQDLIN